MIMISLESLIELLDDLTEHEALLVDAPAYAHQVSVIRSKLENGTPITVLEAQQIQQIHGYMTGIQFAG